MTAPLRAAAPAATGSPVALPPESPASPCVDVCRMDDATGWCTGCLRTLPEIAGWSRLGDDGKRTVWAALPQRRAAWALRHAAEPGADAVAP